ncbi:MAG: hypothetical protein ABJA67_03350, partial [Chthonomonadales bacterium]
DRAVEYLVERVDGSNRLGQRVSSTNWHDSDAARPLCGYRVVGLDADGIEVGRTPATYAINATAAWGVAYVGNKARIRTDETFPGIILETEGVAPQAVKLDGIEKDWVVQDVAVSADKNILITVSRSKIGDVSGWMLYDKKYRLISKHVMKSGKGDGQFRSPMGGGFDSGGKIYIADTGNNRIQQFNSKGKFVGVIAENVVRLPMKVTVDDKGRMLVADSGNNRVAIFTVGQEGKYALTSSLMSGMKEPCYVYSDEDANVFVSTNRVAGIYEFNAKGDLIWTYRGTDDEPVSGPRGLWMNGKELNFVDVSTNEVRTVRPGR